MIKTGVLCSCSGRFYLLEMEQGLLQDLQKVLPPNSGGAVQEEWIQGDDDNRTIEW